jgi:hypothetical protein
LGKLRYIQQMTAATEIALQALPSATPEEADVKAWNALSRQAQLNRYREALAHPDCDALSALQMSDILNAARERVVARRRG